MKLATCSVNLKKVVFIVKMTTLKENIDQIMMEVVFPDVTFRPL